jgi:hypothetical protein
MDNRPIPYDSRTVLALRRRHEDRVFVETAQRVAQETSSEPETVLEMRLLGEPASLRGIPAIGRGIGGASPGTRPGARFDYDDDDDFLGPMVAFG